jgi:hypothetical protein
MKKAEKTLYKMLKSIFIICPQYINTHIIDISIPNYMGICIDYFKIIMTTLIIPILPPQHLGHLPAPMQI